MINSFFKRNLFFLSKSGNIDQRVEKRFFFFLEKILGIKKSLIDLKKRFAKVFYFCTRHESDTWRHVTQWRSDCDAIWKASSQVKAASHRFVKDAMIVPMHLFLFCPQSLNFSLSKANHVVVVVEISLWKQDLDMSTRDSQWDDIIQQFLTTGVWCSVDCK